MIRLSKSTITEEDKLAVRKVLDKEFLGMGEEVGQFESRLKSILKHGEVCCVSSGTAALHLALSACDIGPGDEVLLPSLTYVASYQAISATGAKPVSCDIEKNTLFIDPNDVERRITKHTKAIMPVHYASDAPQLKQIYELALKHKLRVIEDAAHSLGSDLSLNTKGIKRDIICYSFDGIKNITSGEGGAICTNDDQVMAIARDARLLGVEKDSDKRLQNNRSWNFDVQRQGYRYHMSNIMAALGQSQLSRLEKIIAKRQTIAEEYLLQLANIESVEPLQLNYKKITPHIFVVKINDNKRDSLKKYLKEQGIETGIHYFPNHFLSKYKFENKLPVTEAVYQQIISLPCHLDLSQKDVEYICKRISTFYNEN